MVAVDEVGGGGRVPVVGASAMAMTVVLADADLMAAQPEAMLAAAAAFEGAAHRVNSVSDATVRSSQALLAAWEGNGAAGFRTRVSRLTSSMPAAAQALLATAGALRTLAPKIAEAQALARRAGLLFEQVASAARSTAFPAHALEADAATAALMTERANTMGRQAFAAATAAFDAITGISPSAKSAVLASDVKVAPARRSHVHPRKHGGLDSQVKVVTEANGQRVYSFDGGLKIPVNMRGARRIVSGVEGYMPRFEHTYQAAGLSGRALWFNAVENYCTSVIGAAPQKLRTLFFTDRFSSITMRQAAGTSMFMITGTVEPTPVPRSPNADFMDNGDGPPAADVVSNDAARLQIRQADRELGTGAEGIHGIVDPDKWDYLFGRVTSNEHNEDRSIQIEGQLARIGITDTPEGRALIRANFNESLSSDSALVRSFTTKFGDFQVRESLFAGPRGLLKFETTWEVTEGGYRLITVVPYGGGR